MFAWEALFAVGALALGFGLAYAVARNAGRNKANDAITEEATREEYDHPDTYMKGRKQRLDKQIKPS